MKKCPKKYSSIHLGKDLRKRSRKQTCKRTTKECLDEWIGVKAVVGSGDVLRVSVNVSGRSGGPSRDGHPILRISPVEGGS